MKTTLAITLLLTSLFNAYCQCHTDDWTALKALYESTDGDNWTINTGWEIVKSDTIPTNCKLTTLHGITLEGNERVSDIFLGANNLNGSLPPQLSEMNHLKRLALFGNNITGDLPPELGNLSNLILLNLFACKVSGNLPPELGNLVNLKYLDFYGNEVSGSIPPELGNLTNLDGLLLGNNNLVGEIPSELGDLKNLKRLYLEHNILVGNIPPEFVNLINLTELILGGNKLNGNIPPQLGSLNNLTDLYLGNSNLSGSIPSELGDLTQLTSLNLEDNQLSGNIPSELGKLNNLEYLFLNINNLTGSIPMELGNLAQLTNLLLSSNNLIGTIPPELGNLSNLKWLYLSENQLSGSIPSQLGNLSNLWQLGLDNNHLNGTVPILGKSDLRIGINHNYFSCEDIQENFNHNIEFDKFMYLPQFYTPTNYASIKSNIFDTITTSRNLLLEISFPWDETNNLTYQWQQNGVPISGASQPTLNIENVDSENAGIYTLHVYNENCLATEDDFELVSNPVYVIVKGYDLFGEPAQYDQIMVKFDNIEETEKYKNEILTPNAGWVKKACNCNRELYLWQFPSTEAAIAALLEIDEKTKRIKGKNRPKGGFNNNLSIGKSTNTPIAYNIISNSFNDNYPDSVSVFILDSGLDEQDYNAEPFLYNQAPVDSCYEIEKSSGYSYIDSIATISRNYSDELWHGTFGFHSITKDLQDKAKLKLIPLKIFDKNGKGNLFDMTCALYHSIDHNADIINISAGYEGQPSEILESAINLAREKGIFITAAAGNDTLNIDNTPQYPAYYAGQYYKFETIDATGNVQLDSIKYDNVISVASIDDQDNLSLFSNYGKQSVTIATYGENIHSYGIDGFDVVASGSSMATYFATRALALEIAKNNKRDYQKIWTDFETNWLKDNSSLINKTQTGKQINFGFEEAIIEGCTDPGSVNYFIFANEDDGSCITGIEDNNYKINVDIYPNPSTGIVFINFDEILGSHKKVEVFNSGGELKFLTNSFNDNKLNLNGYASGIYFIKISNDSKNIIQRLVIN